ncbi:MAG: amidohydrolase [Phycisphaerales bacterium]
MPTALRAAIQAELPDLVRIRRDLHQHPELSWEERRTSALAARQLAALGMTVRTALAKGTGLVGYLPATRPTPDTPTVALRADMDALPIHEATGKPHASTTPNVMHACGHDGHTTILLGAARVLARTPERPNHVAFLFQPAEENGGGGEHMVKDGALALKDSGLPTSRPTIDRIFGLHGWPTMPLGSVGSRPGPLLASTDDFVVTIRGVGGHAAFFHAARDPIAACSNVVVALQTIASRGIDAREPFVCSVCQINAGTANNIIPETCTITGTIRTLSPATRATARELFFRVVEHTAQAHGCRAEIDWQPGYPVTANDHGAAERFFSIARDSLGPERVIHIPTAFMGGEDFSYYAEHVPACFFCLGLTPAGQEPPALLHQPGFDFNDEAIPTGVELMCRLALQE